MKRSSPKVMIKVMIIIECVICKDGFVVTMVQADGPAVFIYTFAFV